MIARCMLRICYKHSISLIWGISMSSNTTSIWVSCRNAKASCPLRGGQAALDYIFSHKENQRIIVANQDVNRVWLIHNNLRKNSGYAAYLINTHKKIKVMTLCHG